VQQVTVTSQRKSRSSSSGAALGIRSMMNSVNPAATAPPTAERNANMKSSTNQTTISGITVKTPAMRFDLIVLLKGLRSAKVQFFQLETGWAPRIAKDGK